MSNFGLNQGTSDGKQHAEVYVPGCGHKNYDNGPIIHIEFEDGKPIMYIWADINQEDFTHRISLDYALESNREEEQENSDVGKADNGSG